MALNFTGFYRFKLPLVFIVLLLIIYTLPLVTSDTPPDSLEKYSYEFLDPKVCQNVTSCEACTATSGCGWCPAASPYCIPTSVSGPLPGFTCNAEIRYKTCLVSLAAAWVGLIIVVVVLSITIPLGLYCYRRRDEIAARLSRNKVETNLNAMASKFRAKYGRSDKKGWINI